MIQQEFTEAAKLYVKDTKWKQFTTHYEYYYICLLYTSDAADERSSVDLGGRRIIKKKNNIILRTHATHQPNIYHCSQIYKRMCI